MFRKVGLVLFASVVFFTGKAVAASVDSLNTVDSVAEVSGDVNPAFSFSANDSAASFLAGNAGEDTSKIKQVVTGVVDSLVGDITTPTKPKGLSFRSVAIPVGMIGLGTLTAFSKDMQKANLFVREQIYEDRNNQKPFKLDDYTILAPVAAVYALNLAGVKGKNNFVDRSVMLVMSQAISTLR